MGFAEWKKSFQFKKTSNLELNEDAQAFLRARRLVFFAFRDYSRASGITNYFTDNVAEDVNYDPMPGLMDGFLLAKLVCEADPRMKLSPSEDAGAKALTRSGTKVFKSVLKWAKDEGFRFDHPLGS
ncbi:hypothetical protein ADUPG1_008696, partial [Aduncisulcus paluster]